MTGERDTEESKSPRIGTFSATLKYTQVLHIHRFWQNPDLLNSQNPHHFRALREPN